MKEEDIYEVRETTVKRPFRLYVDNEWISSYETEIEALSGLSSWIAKNGLESFVDGLEYVFDSAFVCKVLKIKTVLKVPTKEEEEE